MGRAVRHRWAILCTALVAAAAAGGCAFSGRPAPPARVAPPHSVPSVSATPEALIEAHNQTRARHGRPPLEADPRLQSAALAHANDMAGHRAMRHRGSDGSSPFARMADQGYNFRRAAENVAAGQGTVEEVMRGWMGSPGHRRNILGPFSQIGAACATAEDGTPYWCVTFGQP